MRNRAVRLLQEPARWVPAALDAMLFTPWSPHLSLPGRTRLQRPTYEEPIEAGTLPRFIEFPTATTKNPKSDTATSQRREDVKRQPRIQSQKQRRRNEEKTSKGNFSRTVANILISRCHRCSHRLVNGDSWSTDTETSRSVISRRKRGEYPKTSKTNRSEYSVSPCRW